MNLDNQEQVTMPTPLEIGQQQNDILNQVAAPLRERATTTFADVKEQEDANKAILENSTVMERRAVDLVHSGLGGVGRWMYHQSIPEDKNYKPSDNFDYSFKRWGPDSIDHLMEARSQEEFNARESDLMVREYHAKGMTQAGFGENTAAFITTLLPDLAIGIGAPVAAGRGVAALGATAKGVLQATTAATIVEGGISGAGYVYGDPNMGAEHALLFMAGNAAIAMGVQRYGMKNILKQDAFETASNAAQADLKLAVEAAQANVDAGKTVIKTDAGGNFGYESANLNTLTTADNWVDNIHASPELVEKLHTAANHYERAGFGEHAKLMRSKSEAGRMFAATLLDDGATGARQNMTATGYNQMYQARMDKAFAGIDTAWRDFRISKGHTRIPGTKLFINPKSGRDSMREMEEGIFDVLAHWDNAGSRIAIDTIDPSIVKAAHAHADTMELAPNILRGGDDMADAFRVMGSEGLKKNAGYMPLKWNHEGIKAVGKEKATAIISKGYINRGMDPELAEEIAGAVIQRQADKAVGRGAVTDDYDDILTILDDVIAGRTKDVSLETAQKVQAGLHAHDSGKSGFMRSRTDIDLTIPGMKELVSTDIIKNARAYISDVSGQAALARKGIRSSQELENIVDATARDIVLKDKGKVYAEVKQDLDDIIAGFMSRPVKNALGETGRRVQQGTNLALLGQLGFMQAAETANIASHAFAINAMKSDAFKDTFRAIKETFWGSRSAGKTRLVKEFEEAAGVTFGIEDKVMRHAVNLDDKINSLATRMTAKLDYGLNAGNHLQGYLSGYHFFRGKQQVMAMDMFLNNIKRISDQGSFDKAAKQLSSAGIDEQLFKRLDKAMKQHAKTVDGKVQMNFAKWESGLVDNLLVSSMRNMDQVIQTARNGETPLLLSRGAGNFLSTLLKFPLLAMEKQMLRNLAEGGVSQATSAIAFGMLYNSALYSARAAMTSHDEETYNKKMDPVHLMHGSLMMTPAAGILANMISIGGGFMGAELYGSNYSSGGGITGLSPMLSFTDRTMSGVAKAVQGDPLNRSLMSTIPTSNVLGLVHIKNTLDDL